MATNPTALWSRASVEGNQIYPILELQTPTLFRLLYPVREGTFLIGREYWERVTKQLNENWDQFSFLGNQAPYEFIELDKSTVLDLSIPSSRPLTFPGGQSKNGYRAR